MALLLAQARNVPQAHARPEGRAAGSGRKWEGVELHGKTLGVVGLGRIGALVAQRAMRLRHADHRLRPLRVARARPGRWASTLVTARRAGGRRPTSSPSTCAKTHGDHRPHRRRAAWPRPSPASGSSTAPAAASSTRRRWPTPSAPARSAAPPSTCSPRSRPPSRRCSSSPRSWSRRTSAPPPSRPRTRPAHTIAEQVVLALGRRLRALRRQRQRRRGVRDRPPVPAAGRAARCACSAASPAACPPTSRSCYEGAHRRARHPHPHPVGAEGPLRCRRATSRCRYVNAPQLAAERGLEVKRAYDRARPRTT